MAGFAIIAPCRNGGPDALILDYKEGGWALFRVGTILACHVKCVPSDRPSRRTACACNATGSADSKDFEARRLQTGEGSEA